MEEIAHDLAVQSYHFQIDKEKLQNIPIDIILGSIMKMRDVFRVIFNRKANGISIIRQPSLLAEPNSEGVGVKESLKTTGEGQTKQK